MTQEFAREGFYEALAEDDAELLYDQAPCGYLSTTAGGTITKINQTMLTLTGHRREDLVGRRFLDLLSPGGRLYHETHFVPMLQLQGMAREIAFVLVRADGTRLHVLVNAVLERDAQGEARSIRTAVFDATERRLYEQELVVQRRRAEESEERANALARTLQQTLVPPAPPAIPGLDVAAAYRPQGDGNLVGGDFYDLFQLNRDTWVAAIGDVCGKGVEAAVVTALVRYTIRAAAVRTQQVGEVLAIANEALLADTTERYATAQIVRLTRVEHTDVDTGVNGTGVQETGAWDLEICSAGHPPALVVTARGDVSEVSSPGMLLGVLPRTSLTTTRRRLVPGETLVLYTDGATEGRRGVELFGEARLRQCLIAAGSRGGDATATVTHLLEEVLAFQSGHTSDDVAVVVLRVPSE